MARRKEGGGGGAEGGVGEGGVEETFSLTFSSFALLWSESRRSSNKKWCLRAGPRGLISSADPRPVTETALESWSPWLLGIGSLCCTYTHTRTHTHNVYLSTLVSASTKETNLGRTFSLLMTAGMSFLEVTPLAETWCVEVVCCCCWGVS